MANHKLNRVKIDKEIFMKILYKSGNSVEKLGNVPEIGYTARSIRRCLKEGSMTEIMFEKIEKYLGISDNDLGVIRNFDTSSESQGEK